jgi:hypothetical protein
MARKSGKSPKGKSMLAAAAAFAASPQGRKLIEQARQYASRPETKERARQVMAQVRARRSGVHPSRPTTPATPSGTQDIPKYGTPPKS